MTEQEKINNRKIISDYVANNYQELSKWWIEMVTSLVAQKTVNVLASRLDKYSYLTVPGEETRVTNLLKPWLEERNLSYSSYSRDPRRESLIIKFGEGKGKKLFVPTHSDVVPPGEGWKTDPFVVSVDLEKDTVYGRGVADNKGSMAATLLTLKILQDCNIKLDGSLDLGIVADEEVHSEEGVDYGLGYLIEQGALKYDYALVPDIGGNMQVVQVAEKGRVVYRVTAKGKQAHASTPQLGINAIVDMAKYIARIQETKINNEEHELLGSYTMNIGEISGGAAANIVPGDCSILIDVRLIPGMTIKDTAEWLQSQCYDLESTFSVDIISGAEAHQLDYKNSGFVKKIQEIGGNIIGHEPKIVGMGGNTYAKPMFLKAGIVSVGYSAGDDAAMHQVDEYASISDHVNLARAFAEIAIDIVG